MLGVVNLSGTLGSGVLPLVLNVCSKAGTVILSIWQLEGLRLGGVKVTQPSAHLFSDTLIHSINKYEWASLPCQALANDRCTRCSLQDRHGTCPLDAYSLVGETGVHPVTTADCQLQESVLRAKWHFIRKMELELLQERGQKSS